MTLFGLAYCLMGLPVRLFNTFASLPYCFVDETCWKNASFTQLFGFDMLMDIGGCDSKRTANFGKDFMYIIMSGMMIASLVLLIVYALRWKDEMKKSPPSISAGRANAGALATEYMIASAALMPIPVANIVVSAIMASKVDKFRDTL